MSPMMLRSSGKFGSSHESTADVESSSIGSHEIDIDFNLTESGRTVANLISQIEKDDDDDFVGITQSGRSFTKYDDCDGVGKDSEQRPPEDEGLIGKTVGDDNNVVYSSSTEVPGGGYDQSSIGSPLHGARSAARPIPNQPQDVGTYYSQQQQQQASSNGSSGSAFLHGIMNQSSNANAAKGVLSHTPPIAPTSYEAHHFGKRVRAGSISGRLRSASEVESNGLIDRQQKAILKDLIISGNQEVHEALDKFDMGDKEALQNMIRDGAFRQGATADMDLLGDLDLDFLTMADSYAGMEAAAAIDPHHNQTIQQQQQIGQQQQQQHHNYAPVKQHHLNQTAFTHPGISKSQPIPMQPPPNLPTSDQQIQNQTVMPNNDGQPTMISPSLQSAYGEADDGIGDLDFNGDFGGAGDEVLHIPSQSGGWGAGKQHIQNSPPTLDEQQRYRSNSLAFGALLGENPNPGELHTTSYNRWVDRHSQYEVAAIPLTNSLNTGSNAVRENGGIGASLEQYGRSKSDSKLKTKAMLAEEKRRIKQEKREQKEREKRERKERREQEKKERGSHDKQERKYKKSAVAKAREERESEEIDGEKMEIPSGSGRPRSMSDPNLSVSTVNGLMEVERPDGWVGAYSPESRKIRIERFLSKRNKRIWTKTVKYDVRKNFADSRLRVKGRFVKKEDEMLMRDLISLT